MVTSIISYIVNLWQNKPDLKPEIKPIEMIKQNNIPAFLKARTVLPCADTYESNFFSVYIGSMPAGIKMNEYVFDDTPGKMFIFHRRKVYGHACTYDWICLDHELQAIIDQNYSETIAMLDSLLIL